MRTASCATTQPWRTSSASFIEKRPDLAAAGTATRQQLALSTVAEVCHGGYGRSCHRCSGAATERQRHCPNARPSDRSLRSASSRWWSRRPAIPQDMLDLDLDLEADLGVDTVKQAEMFAAIRSIYNIPRDENLKLRDYPTLAHVIRFVQEKRPDLAAGNLYRACGRKAAGRNNGPRASPTAIAESPLPALRPTAAASQPRRESGPRRDQGNDSRTGGREDWLSRRTCWTLISTWKPISASTPLSRRRCSPPCAAVYNIPRDENLKLRDYPNTGPRHRLRPGEAARRALATHSGSAASQPTEARSPPHPRHRSSRRLLLWPQPTARPSTRRPSRRR